MDTLQATPDLPLLAPYSQAQLLDIFERILPPSYLNPLKEPGPGYEILEAYAALFARTSEAVANIANGNYIATATSGGYSRGEVELYRATPIFGAFTLKAGTLVGIPGGYNYETLTDVTFSATDLGPQLVEVRAVVRGWLYNRPGPVTLPSGEVLPGPVNRLVRPVLPEGGNFDPTVQVRQRTAMVGGSSPMLDGLGYDRGLPRLPNEQDADYRLRLLLVQQTVTPEALAQTIERLLGPTFAELGLQWSIYEGWDLRVQTAWDMPINQQFTQAEANTPVAAYNANIFVWDYEPPTTAAAQPGAWTNRLWAEDHARYGLILLVPYVASLNPLLTGLYQTLLQARPAGLNLFFLVR